MADARSGEPPVHLGGKERAARLSHTKPDGAADECGRSSQAHLDGRIQGAAPRALEHEAHTARLWAQHQRSAARPGPAGSAAVGRRRVLRRDHKPAVEAHEVWVAPRLRQQAQLGGDLLRLSKSQARLALFPSQLFRGGRLRARLPKDQKVPGAAARAVIRLAQHV